MNLSKLFQKENNSKINKKLNYHDTIKCVEFLVNCAKSPLEKVRAYNYVLFVIKADYAAYSKTRIFQNENAEVLHNPFPYYYYTEDGAKMSFLSNGYRTVYLNDCDSIAVNAWNCKRLADILPVIYQKEFTADDNHRAMHFSEIELTVVYCGNHSISAGIFLKSGKIRAELYDVSNLYEHLDTDGYNWINHHNGQIISKVSCEHIAIMYEISRRKKEFLKSLDSDTEEYCRINGGAFVKSNKKYTLVCGMPCSGKSSYICAANHNGDITIDDKTDTSTFQTLIEQNECIIDEILFSCNAITRIKQAVKRGYYVHLCFIGISLEECIRRSELRFQKTGVGTYSSNNISVYFKKFPDAIANILKYCDAADFYDNENGCRNIAHWDGKTLRFFSGNIPDWFQKIHWAWFEYNSTHNEI